MKQVKHLYLTLALVVGQMSLPTWAETVVTSSSSTTAASTHEDDQRVIRAQAADYAKAFSVADVDALAAMWASDAVYNDSAGNVYNGRDAIKNQMANFFKRWGKRPLEVKVESILFPSDDTAVERGVTCLKDPKSGDDIERYTALHVKRDGKWQMVDVSENFYEKQPSGRESLSALSWFIGNWTVNGPKGTLHLKSDWVGNKNLIRCDFMVEAKDGSRSSGTQFIFWNPETQRICSWQYDGLGGYSTAWWTQSGKTWVAHARSTQPDGCAAWADNIMHQEDANTFTWQSTDRHMTADDLPGKRLPDTDILKATRDKV